MGGEGLRAGSGVFLDGATHVFGGTVLALSFALLWQRRVMAVINIFAWQGFAVALNAFSRGGLQDAPHLFVWGAILLTVETIMLPVGLRAIVRRLDAKRMTGTASGVFPPIACGTGLLVLTILTVLPTTARQAPLMREDLALALSVVLLGLLMMTLWRNALAQVVGFMSLGNGVIMVAIGAAKVPLLTVVSAAYFMTIAVALFGIVVFRIRDRFDNLDSHRLDAPR